MVVGLGCLARPYDHQAGGSSPSAGKRLAGIGAVLAVYVERRDPGRAARDADIRGRRGVPPLEDRALLTGGIVEAVPREGHLAPWPDGEDVVATLGELDGGGFESAVVERHGRLTPFPPVVIERRAGSQTAGDDVEAALGPEFLPSRADRAGA
jgi:hypothetical protein